jgi:hypothetical protein
MMQTFMQYKTTQHYAPKQLKTKGDPPIEAPHRESEAHTSLPNTQIGFERKFPYSKSQPHRPKRVPISSSRLAALNFFNTLGFVSYFSLPRFKLVHSYHEFWAATTHLERKKQATPLLSVKEPHIMSGFAKSVVRNPKQK